MCNKAVILVEEVDMVDAVQVFTNYEISSMRFLFFIKKIGIINTLLIERGELTE